MRLRYLYILLIALFIAGCSEKKEAVKTPWGTSLGVDSMSVSDDFSLDDIISNGELIMLTLTGPDNYYTYRGAGLGTQYLLCEKFAQKIGVALRVEVCKDTTELVGKLEKGEGDIVAFQLPKTTKGVEFCGARVDSKRTQWAVQEGNMELAAALNEWFTVDMIKKITDEQSFFLSTRSITRHVYSPMLDRSKGIISNYDNHFKQYSALARWDWRLMAAQCYQESTFDPRAHSWAGACGLMQIMPGTAEHLGLPQNKMYDPESNIAAAAKYIRQLDGQFNDISNRIERTYFVLASYNGGYHHIRDAMALTRKYGGNQYRWDDVSQYVLKLSQPQYYNDAIVKYGYMRGGETEDYVARIRQRWAQYRGVSGGGFSGSPGMRTPQRATHKHRFDV